MDLISSSLTSASSPSETSVILPSVPEANSGSEGPAVVSESVAGLAEVSTTILFLLCLSYFLTTFCRNLPFFKALAAKAAGAEAAAETDAEKGEKPKGKKKWAQG